MGSEHTKKPNGRVVFRRSNEKPASDGDLLAQVLTNANMRAAWKRVKANKGAAGVDSMSIAQFPAFVREHWDGIRQALETGEYRPKPARRVEIPKSSGGKRPLGIPTVADRVIQQAIAQVLVPIFDPQFSESSYGFRPGRSAQDAVKQIRAYIEDGYNVAVDIDLSKFFDKVSHDVLMNRITRRVRDRRLLRLIGKYLRSGVEIDGKVQPTEEGVPQGGPMSPLLANILLNDLDKELEKRGHRFARYADDFIIVVKSQSSAERVKESVRRFLLRRLKLEVNEEKSSTKDTDDTSFLGFRFKGKRIVWSEEAFEEFKRRVRFFTRRSWGVSMKYRLQRLRVYVRGWMNYYGLSELYAPVPQLDYWLRRRVRMCFLKQWSRPRTRIAALRRLGCTLRQAVIVSRSRGSYWHTARTPVVQMALNDRWLARQGLVSIKELWVALHYSS